MSDLEIIGMSFSGLFDELELSQDDQGDDYWSDLLSNLCIGRIKLDHSVTVTLIMLMMKYADRSLISNYVITRYLEKDFPKFAETQALKTMHAVQYRL